MKRNWLLAIATMLMLTALIAFPAAVLAQDAVVSCDDFATREGAQALLDSTTDDAIIDALDPGGDGTACEELPQRGDDADDNGRDGSGLITTIGVPTEEPEETPEAGATEEPEDEDIDANADPLDGRLGGERETFEALHGEPTGGENDEDSYPAGYDYDVDGFESASVFFIKDRAGYLTLTADPERPWSTNRANQLVEPFLPADTELGEAGDLTDAATLVRAHSVALEKPFGQATFKRYGATGENGDFYYLLRRGADRKVIAIEIALGNELQEHARAEFDLGPTPEEAAYLAEVRRQFAAVTTSMDDFDAILLALDNGSIDGATARSGIDTIFAIWRAANSDARGLTPPATLQSTHDLFIEMTGLLAAAADDYTNGLNNANPALVDTGNEKYRQALLLRILVNASIAED